MREIVDSDVDKVKCDRHIKAPVSVSYGGFYDLDVKRVGEAQ